MTKFRILLCVVVLFAASEASLAQRLGQRLASRHEQRWHTRYHSGADSGSAAIAGWQDDNMSHAVDSGVNLAIDAVSEKLGRLKTGYDVVQGSDEFVNRGLLGNPHKPMQIIAGALSGPLGAAGVGPQADFIVRFAETKANLDMALHDEASAVLNAGIAQQNLDRYGITGDAQDLARAAMAARPDPTQRQLMSAETNKPLIVRPQPGMPGQHPATAVGDLARSWHTTVQKEPFTSKATSPAARANDWVRWKFDPNNIVTTSTFDRTFRGPHGTTRIQSERRQTGTGYEPGRTNRYEHTRVEFRGQRVESWGGGRSGVGSGTGSGSGRSSVGSSGSGRTSFSSPSTLRH